MALSLAVKRYVTGQVFSKMFLHADWAHAGTATAVRDCKCLVQVEVTNISTDESGSCESNLSIHVCAIHVDLSSMLVNYLGDFFYGFFVHTVSAGIGDHDPSEILRMLFGFCFEIFKVDVTIFQSLYYYDLHSCHYCGGRVGA